MHGKTIESFDNPTNYLPITLPITLAPWQTTTVEIEEHRKNTTSDQNYNSLHYRQSSAQNIKINEIANDLKSGKIVGKKIISDAFTFHFIFNVSNNFLSGKSRLTIEVPRRELENIKLPDMKEMCVNHVLINGI
ncbi:hypothetical protein HpMMM19_03910 [Helicobacter pylori]